MVVVAENYKMIGKTARLELQTSYFMTVYVGLELIVLRTILLHDTTIFRSDH
jgi:hypothetical protein